MEKTQLCSMFASLDADLVELALNASGGNVELALNAACLCWKAGERSTNFESNGHRRGRDWSRRDQQRKGSSKVNLQVRAESSRRYRSDKTTRRMGLKRQTVS